MQISAPEARAQLLAALKAAGATVVHENADGLYVEVARTTAPAINKIIRAALTSAMVVQHAPMYLPSEK